MYSELSLKCKHFTYGWILNHTLLKKNYFHVMHLILKMTSDLLSIICVMKDVFELSRNFQIETLLLEKMNFLKEFNDFGTKTRK
jgi:hypothetical protein